MSSAVRSLVALAVAMVAGSSGACTYSVGPEADLAPAGQQQELDGPQSFHWSAAQPVTVVIDSRMRPACIDSTIDAVEFWRQHVGFLELVVADAPVAQPGQIVVRNAALNYADAPDVAGECEPTTDGWQIVSADIALEFCSTTIVAHELGHALGLGHREDDRRALMHPHAYWMELSAAETAQVNVRTP